MSIQDNTTIADEWFATVSARDSGHYADLFSDDIVIRNVFLPAPVQGREAAHHQMEALLAPFQDYHIELKTVIVSDHQFVCQLKFTGNQDKPIDPEPDIPIPSPNSSGKSPQSIIFVAIVRQGKVVELHQFPDYPA